MAVERRAHRPRQFGRESRFRRAACRLPWPFHIAIAENDDKGRPQDKTDLRAGNADALNRFRLVYSGHTPPTLREVQQALARLQELFRLSRHYVIERDVTDNELVFDAGRGSREAFEALFARYRGPIWQFFRRRVAETARAEELTQDTFVALLEGASRYEARTTFRAYLFGIAHHVLSTDRRRSVHRWTDSLDFDPAGRGSDPDAGLWVRRALAQLDDDAREILMLREYDELSYQEIADLRQLPVNTVRSRLFRARMALRAALVPDADSVRATR